MSEVFWRRNKHYPTDAVWTDLRDSKLKAWVVTYRDVGTKWLVMYTRFGKGEDRYIDKADMSEEQLRNDLKLQYLLMRGET